jgi:putative membrane protein
MYTGRRYTASSFFKWTLRKTLCFILIAAVPTFLYAFGWHFLSLPWQPVALLGTALAFSVGFKNNASYARLWEARQIYGAIINDSRSFAFTLRDTLGGKEDETVKMMFYRHFAWLTTLRFQLREFRPWENTKNRSNKNFSEGNFVIPEWQSNVEEELKQYLNEEELAYILSKKNKSTQLIALQSETLGKLKKEGVLSHIEWLELQNCITRLIDNQGKAERIKNFPYPRNFETVMTFLMYIFIFLLPFGLLKEYAVLGKDTFLQDYTIWFNIPFTALIAWAFHILDTIGESSVNPFEGNPNDVPITQISRMVEIDLKDMLDDKNLPAPLAAQNNILM